jgi:hypothetical protein
MPIRPVARASLIDRSESTMTQPRYSIAKSFPPTSATIPDVPAD